MIFNIVTHLCPFCRLSRHPHSGQLTLTYRCGAATVDLDDATVKIRSPHIMIHIRKPDIRDMYLSMVQTTCMWYMLFYGYIFHQNVVS